MDEMIVRNAQAVVARVRGHDLGRIALSAAAFSGRGATATSCLITFIPAR
jgi:hypothetical protein